MLLDLGQGNALHMGILDHARVGRRYREHTSALEWHSSGQQFDSTYLHSNGLQNLDIQGFDYRCVFLSIPFSKMGISSKLSTHTISTPIEL